MAMDQSVDEVNKKTRIEKSLTKGQHLICNDTIEANQIVAFFGKCLLEVNYSYAENKYDMDEYVSTYAILWPFPETKKNSDAEVIHYCKDSQDFKEKYRANLVNEPYQVKKEGKVKVYSQNVVYCEDWDRKIICLMSCRRIEKNEEILWYYGRGYPLTRNYFVYPPPDEYVQIRIIQKNIIRFEPDHVLPHILQQAAASDSVQLWYKGIKEGRFCSYHIYTKYVPGSSHIKVIPESAF